MKSLRIIPIAALSFTLISCQTLSSLRPAPSTQSDINSSLSQTVTDIPNSWQAAQTKLGDVSVGWIDQLGDPILANLVREAQAHNRDLQAAAYSVQRAYALARQAGVPLKPTIAANPGVSRTMFLDGPIPDSAILTWGVGVSWEPDLWGRIKADQKNVYATAQAAEADYKYSQHSIAAAVARTYFGAIEALQQVEVSRRSLANLTETNRIVTVQYAEGLAMAQDVALSGSDLATTQSNLAVAQGGYRTALRALEILVGRYPSADVEVAQTLPSMPDLPSSANPASLAQLRPDLIADGLNVAATFYNLDSAKVNRLPKLSLNPATGSSSNQLLDLLNPKQIFLQLAGDITYLIFDGGFNKALIDEATAQQKSALASYASAVLTAFEEVETSLDQTGVLRDQVTALQKSAEEANRALKIANIRYNEGESDLLDVLNIQSRVVGAESSLVTAQRSRLDQWITLNLALGGSWE